MGNTSMMHIRIDDRLKEDATSTLEKMGLSMPEAVRVFLKRVVAEQAIPFALRVPNATTVAAIKEARAMSDARFDDIDEMLGSFGKAEK